MATTQTSSEVKFYIGPAAADTVDTEAEYEALSYIPVSKILNIGDLGDQSQEVTADYLDTARTEVYKGIRRAPTLNLEVGFDPDDAGQQALLDAEGDPRNFAFKIEYNDAGAGSPSSPTTVYFRGQVLSKMRGGFSPNSILTRTFMIAPNSPEIEVAAV